MLSVHMNVFETEMVRALRTSCFKRKTSNEACSSSFEMESAFMGATLSFSKDEGNLCFE